jgi:hypothetical protein
VYVTSQRLGKNFTAEKNTQDTIKNCWARRFICGPCRIKESLWVYLRIPLTLLGNGSVNTFSRQRGIVGDVFYAVRVVSKESRRLVLPKTSVRISTWWYKYRSRYTNYNLLFLITSYDKSPENYNLNYSLNLRYKDPQG